MLLGQLLTECLQCFLRCWSYSPTYLAPASLAIYLRQYANVITRPRPGFQLFTSPYLRDKWCTKMNSPPMYNIYYVKPGPDPYLIHQCTCNHGAHSSPCNVSIYAATIRQHLDDHHPGYSGYGDWMTCTCGVSLLPKSYPDHVLEQHCGVSYWCPYCLRMSSTRGDSVTRHCIDSCPAFKNYRRHG